jgi:hypothetical protein
MKQLIVALLLLCLAGTACNNEKKETTASMDTGTQVDLNKMRDIWNNLDTVNFRSMTTPDLLRNTNGKMETNNQEGYIGSMNLFHTAFPDLNIAIDSSRQMDGKAYIYWTLTGTNTGKMGDAPPTNKKVTTHGFSIWYFNSENKGFREDAFFDNMDMYQQLGYKLTPPAS